MKTKITFLILATMFYANTISFAQRACGTVDYYQQQLNDDPTLQQRRDQLEQFTQNFIAGGCVRITNSVISIPVVVHVLHHGESIGSGLNISDARIMEQINVLNDDFARVNADASNTPSVFQSIAVNTRIQFCLAQRTPNCTATNGIIRKFTSVNSFSPNDDMKRNVNGGDDAWPTKDYLNLWICNLGGGLLGYAQFPGGPASTDGVVLLFSSVGGPNVQGTANPYHLGRTATHEVGHWLNLNHIWGDDGGACSGTDNVGDTPNQGDLNFGCPSFPHVSCGNGPDGDMFMNYMDYTDDNCMNAFTSGQSDRMYAVFNYPSSPRATLLSSPGCIPPGFPLNLWAQDTQEDIGNEPNNESNNLMWISQDIWVRNQNDNGFIHQNPTPNALNYVYVRVRNTSCTAYSGSEQVKLNWAKASTNLTWPENWDGSITVPVLMGDEVSAPQTIPNIPSGGAVIVKFPWTTPDPANYNMIPEPWHFCLVAHIGTPNIPETSSIFENVKNNNNIVWKNVSIAHSPVGFVIHNSSAASSVKKITFEVPANEIGNSIINLTNVRVRLSNSLYQIWVSGGKQGTNISESNDLSIKLLGNGATISNLNLPPKSFYRIVVTIPHILPPLVESVYNIDILQYEGAQTNPEGGERLTITSCDLVTPEIVNPNPVLSGTNITCYGINNGTASLDSGLYTNINWTGPNSFASTLHNIIGLAPGTYSVTGVDSVNNNVASSITITEPGISATEDNNACTIDGCEPASGIFHNQVTIDDNNICTTDACDSATGNISHTPTNCVSTLNANIIFQGFYLGGGLMSNCLFITGVSANPLDADSVTISLMSATPPYELIDAQVGIVKTNGDVTVTFGPAVIVGNLYYIKINHRNSIETWSSVPLLFSLTTSYSFSTSAAQAFGANEALTDDNLYFAVYSGDINQDGAVDASDFLELDPEIQNGDGGYVIGDINGDGAVDATDFLVLDPNIQNGTGAATP